MVTQKGAKKQEFFECKICDFVSSKKCDWIRHTTTRKHRNSVKCDASVTLFYAENKYCCESCSKEYSSRNGLWSHKKKCLHGLNNNSNNQIILLEKKEDLRSSTPASDKHDIHTLTNLVVEVVKQNQELTKQIAELSKTSHVTNNSITTNKFNLNFFLQEECKDALNITDFIDSLKLTLGDLETVGSKGFIYGISNIFVNKLKELDICKRPVHCSDVKREVLYIKDKDMWEKDNEENKKLKNAIMQISHKNIQQIQNWVKENPNCKDSNSVKNDEYLHLINNSMCGSSEEEGNNIKYIIKNIAKEVTIDKL